MGALLLGACDVIQGGHHLNRLLRFYPKSEIIKKWSFLMLDMYNMTDCQHFVLFSPKKGKKHTFSFTNGLTTCYL